MTNYITRNYELATGATLVVSFDARLQDNCCDPKATVTLMRVDGSYAAPVEKKVSSDDSGLFINWKGTRVYLKDFKFMTTKELIEKMKTQYVSDDEILATMLRDKADFGIVTKFTTHTEASAARMREYGCPVNLMKQTQLHGRFDERSHSSRYWHNEISFMPKQEKYRKEVQTATYSLSNFCFYVREGSIRIYSISEYADDMAKQEMLCKMENETTAKEGVIASILRFFSRNATVACE